MRLIIITLPYFSQKEALLINDFFENGLKILHLRKPNSDITRYMALIELIKPEFHSKIVIHEHFELHSKYQLKGIHLNRRNSVVPSAYNGDISASCHSLDDVATIKQSCDYVFLSPIYDSISKKEYKSAFDIDFLKEQKGNGIIDEKVFALGGVTLSKLDELKSIGFGGAAVLGDAWDKPMKYFNYLNNNQ